MHDSLIHLTFSRPRPALWTGYFENTSRQRASHSRSTTSEPLSPSSCSFLVHDILEIITKERRRCIPCSRRNISNIDFRQIIEGFAELAKSHRCIETAAEDLIAVVSEGLYRHLLDAVIARHSDRAVLGCRDWGRGTIRSSASMHGVWMRCFELTYRCRRSRSSSDQRSRSCCRSNRLGGMARRREQRLHRRRRRLASCVVRRRRAGSRQSEALRIRR